jgi:3-deoxy-D-manno-octulosonic-acid transferase
VVEMLIVWSLVLEGVCLIVRFFSLFNRFLRLELGLRKEIFVYLKSNVMRQDNVFFFCSSAGEYEQAKPLFKYFRDKKIYIFFFSSSGYKFAESQQENNSFFLAPIDSLWKWRIILKTLKPKYFIVVRYELWPSMLFLARKYSVPILINAGEQKKGFLKTYLLRFFVKIFCVSKKANKSLEDLSCKGLVVSGDTKYERIIERKQENYQRINFLQSSIKKKFDKNILLVGSAWPQDLDIIFNGKTSKNYQIIIVFHQISSANNDLVKRFCKRNKLSCFFTENIFVDLKDKISEDVVVINQMGILFELYSIATRAFVGGGSHFRVHNVLEPFAFSIPIAFGPFYKNSHEACDLVERKFATVLITAADIVEWISQNEKNCVNMELSSFSEASKKIAHCLVD